jgi:hypothetical protein
MPIVAGDILMKLSVKTGSAGDSTAGTVAGSLGKYVSTTAVTTATLNNLFDDVSGAEAAAGMVDYRCVFIHNNHATLTLIGATVALTSQTAGGGTIDIALDNIAASAKGSASAQAAEIVNETMAPTGVGTFGTSTLTLGDLTPGQVRAIWLRRTVTAGASPLNPDGVILTPGGDTLP